MKAKRFQFWFAALWLGFAPMASAQTVGADAQDMRNAALNGPSARLALYARALANLPQDSAAIDQGKVFAGLYHKDGPPKLIARGLHLQPVLMFDDNINGGLQGQTVILRGLPFDIDPSARAVSGLLAGAQLGGFARYSLAHGRVIEARASAAKAVQLGGALDVVRTQAQLCAAQYLGKAHWLDICAAQSAVLRELAKTNSKNLSAAVSRQFAAPRAYGEIGLRVQRMYFDTHDAANLGVWLHLARRNMMSFQGEIGQPTAGHHSRLFAASAALTRPIMGKNTTLFAQFARDGGGMFLGQTRMDETWALGVTRPFFGGGAVTLSFGQRNSNVANFSGPLLGLSFTLYPSRL